MATNSHHPICKKITTRKHSNGILDNEFHQVFIAEPTTDITELTIQKDEVAELKLYDLSVLTKTIDFENLLLPEYQEYYNFVYQEILKVLKN